MTPLALATEEPAFGQMGANFGWSFDCSMTQTIKYKSKLCLYRIY